MNLIFSLGLTLSFLFFGLSMIHVYWSLGGRRGIDASIPTNENGKKLFNPGIFGSLMVAMGLLIFGIFVLIKAGILNMLIPWMVSQYGLRAIALIFLLRAIGDFKYVGFFKRMKYSDFARKDTRLYTPLCMAIAFLSIMIELSE